MTPTEPTGTPRGRSDGPVASIGSRGARCSRALRLASTLPAASSDPTRRVSDLTDRPSGRASAPARGGLRAQLLVLDLALELLQAAPQVAAHGRRGQLLGEP